MTQTFSFEWFKETGDLAQWLIFVALIISAIFIFWQIKEQTHARKGENFQKIIDILSSDSHSKTVDLMYDYSRMGAGQNGKKTRLLHNPDSKLPSEIKDDVNRIRKNHEAVGLMVYVNMVDSLDFLLLYSTEVRDMWNILMKNMKRTTKERNKGKLKSETYFEYFDYIGKFCDYWKKLTKIERSFFKEWGFLPNPDSWSFKIRYHFLKEK